MALPGLRVVDEVREFFLLRDSEQRARGLAAETATALQHDVALSVQKRDAAELLFQAGARAEALALAKESFVLVDRHAELAPGVVKAREELRAASETLPALDEDVTGDHLVLYQKLVDAESAYHHVFAGMVLAPNERKRRRISRISVTAATVLFLTVVSVTWYRRIELLAEASASWGAAYPASAAVDGSEATHWLLPDHAPGYLDIKINPPRKISTVSILNGYEPPRYGVVDYVIEARSGEEVVKSVPGTFTGTGGTKPPWVDVAVNSDRKADRVRIVVKTFRDLGGSIAEVKVK